MASHAVGEDGTCKDEEPEGKETCGKKIGKQDSSQRANRRETEGQGGRGGLEMTQCLCV